MAREQRGQPAAMIMKVILTNVSCKKGAAMREREKDGVGGRERETDGEHSAERDRRQTHEGQERRGENARPLPTSHHSNMHTHTSPTSRARKDARGMLGPRWTTRIHIPTATSRAQGLPRRWGNVRGMLEGWGCYIRPARGGESSVHPREAYRSRSIGHTIVAPGVDGAHLAFAGCTRSYLNVAGTNGERNVRRETWEVLSPREEDYDGNTNLRGDW